MPLLQSFLMLPLSSLLDMGVVWTWHVCVLIFMVLWGSLSPEAPLSMQCHWPELQKIWAHALPLPLAQLGDPRHIP